MADDLLGKSRPFNLRRDQAIGIWSMLKGILDHHIEYAKKNKGQRYMYAHDEAMWLELLSDMADGIDKYDNEGKWKNEVSKTATHP